MNRCSGSMGSLQSLLFPEQTTAYDLKDIIGYGASSVVWRAICRDNGKEVAVKIIDLEGCTISIDQIRKEISSLESCNHPNVVRYYCSFISGHTIWLVMQYVSGGSIQDIMRYRFRQGLGKEAIATIISQVLSALKYLHQHKILHRDIRCGNILLDSDGTVYLTDFGLSRLFTGINPADFTPIEGTLCWMAPEVLRNKQWSVKSDIWALGITALEMARGSAPYSNLPEMKAIMLILENPSPTFDQSSEKEKFGRSLKDFVDLCLEKDASKRHASDFFTKHRLFKNHPAKKDLLVEEIIRSIPPLPQRARELRIPEKALSQQVYYGLSPRSSVFVDPSGPTLQDYYAHGMMSNSFESAVLRGLSDADEWDFGKSH